MNASTINAETKVFGHLDTLAAIKRGENPPPITVSFTLTDLCNNRCPRCMEASGRNPDMPSMQDPKRLLRQCKDLGVKGITFSGGGEPLVYPGAVDVIEYAKCIGLDCGLVTNGLAIKPDDAVRLPLYCSWIRVSLDASNAEEYQATHGMPPKAFEIVMENIRRLAQNKGRCTVGVGYLTGEVNRGGIVRAAEMVRDTGADYINYRPFEGDKIDYTDEIEAARALETPTFKVVYKPSKYEEWWKVTYPRCVFQRLYPLIAADGHVYPCCDTRGKREYSLGCVYERPLAEIWRDNIDRVDFTHCMPNCIGHRTNAILNDVFAPKTHPNHL